MKEPNSKFKIRFISKVTWITLVYFRFSIPDWTCKYGQICTFCYFETLNICPCLCVKKTPDYIYSDIFLFRKKPQNLLQNTLCLLNHVRKDNIQWSNRITQLSTLFLRGVVTRQSRYTWMESKDKEMFTISIGKNTPPHLSEWLGSNYVIMDNQPTTQCFGNGKDIKKWSSGLGAV